MRSRPPVGRRLWRRRRRRTDDGAAFLAADGASGVPSGTEEENAATDAQHHHGDRTDGDVVDGTSVDDDRDVDDGADDDPGDGDASPAAVPPASTGLLAWLLGRGKRAPVAAVATTGPVVVDPLAEITALPRGIARLEAYAQRFGSLPDRGAGGRRIALAWHRELTTMADDAGLDLGLLEGRVAACAQALIAVDEAEKAGDLLARLGRRGQAAELFVKAGAIEALEEQHAEEAWHQGGPRLEARLAFQRFEALFIVGMRDEALAALERARALCDNPLYVEVLTGFRARLPTRSMTLSAGNEVLRVTSGLPLLVGRGEECGVRVDSPLVGRAHVELARRGDSIVARDLASVGGSSVDDLPLTRPTALAASRGTLQVAGVVLDYEKTPDRLLFRPRLRPDEATLVALGDRLHEPRLGVTFSIRDGRFRLVGAPTTRLNGESLSRDTLLLVGDRVGAGGRTFVVAER